MSSKYQEAAANEFLYEILDSVAYLRSYWCNGEKTDSEIYAEAIKICFKKRNCQNCGLPISGTK